jgi:uncharacterized membrane protein
MSGLAAVCLGGPSERLSPQLRRNGVRATTALLAAGELVADQLPSAPPRTDPSGLVPRLALGAVTAHQLSRGTGAPATVAGLLGSTAALGAAFGGLALRRRLSERWAPIPAAIVEDVVCACLATAAVRLSVRPAGGAG